MIACVSPADYNYEETLSTLRYASRAKNIANKPKINEDPKDAMLREYQNEIEILRKMLEKSSANIRESENYTTTAIDMQEQINKEKLKIEKEFEEKAKNLRQEQGREKEELIQSKKDYC